MHGKDVCFVDLLGFTGALLDYFMTPRGEAEK